MTLPGTEVAEVRSDRVWHETNLFPDQKEAEIGRQRSQDTWALLLALGV